MPAAKFMTDKSRRTCLCWRLFCRGRRVAARLAVHDFASTHPRRAASAALFCNPQQARCLSAARTDSRHKREGWRAATEPKARPRRGAQLALRCLMPH